MGFVENINILANDLAGGVGSTAANVVLCEDAAVATAADVVTTNSIVSAIEDGRTWFFDTVDPTTAGTDGDMAYNTVSNESFMKITGTWVSQGVLTGPQGIQGIQGIQGVQGEIGLTGDAGISAYEEAVLAGYVGTEAQWLASLVGAQGIQGETGLTGDTGATGNGIASVILTNTVGDVKTYTITFTDTTTTTFDVVDGTDGIDGTGVDHVSKTAGTGAAGTTDTYTVWGDLGETVNLGTFTVYNGTDGAGAGDMTKAVYDPTNISASAFDTDNHISGTTNKVYTAIEQSKLSGIAVGAEVNTINAADIGISIQGYSADTVIDASYVHTDTNYTATEASKLAGIATGATANSSDATLLARANHTGTQLASTVSDFASAVTSAETSHADVLVDGDFIANGYMKRTAAGVYTTVDETYSLSTHNHTGVYEPADATILKDADIGVNVQAYDATIIVDADIGVSVQAYDVDTTKNDILNTFTVSQRGTLTTDNDGSFDMNVTNRFKCTPTANFTLTFTNIASQGGSIILDNTGGYTVSAAATTKVDSTLLATISAAGIYVIGYEADGTNVYVTGSQALA